LFGVEAEAGVYGSHEWKRSQVGLEYRGGYRHYNSNTYYNGSDHIATLDFQTQPTKRSTILLRTLGGTLSRPLTGLAESAIDPLLYATAPINELFNNRTYFIDTSATYFIQRGPRNAFGFMGGGFAVRRQSNLLVGVNGYRAGVDFTRRVSRMSTVGVVYSFLHFDFPRGFGFADIHTVAGQYSRQFGRKWRLTALLGVFRIDSLGLRRVTVDPIVRELLGVTEGIEAVASVNYTPNIHVRLSRMFRKSSLDFAYFRGISPGNGLLLTARQESGSAGYSYTGVRRWTFGANMNYTYLAGVGVQAGQFKVLSGGGSASYFLGHSTHLMLSVDQRRFTSGSTDFRRSGTRAIVGLGFAPGNIPLSFR
jgi:hypothetical protein